jgi:CRISPR/Cas system CMR-associated protein Cmr1 (group 7 of RAMP superfamily)
MTDGKWPAGVPYLKAKPRYNVSKAKGTQIKVWEHIFTSLRDFRQQRYGSKHGLSQWPEANEIRRYHSISAKFPEKESDDEEDIVLIEKFPRAKFGLPIQFNMPHDESIGEKKIELHGKKLGEKKYIDRLASPLILRPIACMDGKDESAVGIALILEWETIGTNENYTPPGGLFLSSEVKGDFQVKSNLENDEEKNIKPLNLSGKPQSDVLQAFLDYLK